MSMICPLQRDRILSALRRGVARKEVAATEVCPRSRVDYIAREAGLSVEGQGRRRAPNMGAKVGPAPDAAADSHTLRGDITATQGRYAALAAFADAHGMTYAGALQMWHKARLGLPVAVAPVVSRGVSV